MTSGMRTIRIFITYIAALLSVATAVLSCSIEPNADFVDMEGTAPRKSILITGTVINMEGKALEDIAINFKAYPKDNADAAPVSTETAYSNSKGIFSIMADGAEMELLCIVTDLNKSVTFEIDGGIFSPYRAILAARTILLNKRRLLL